MRQTTKSALSGLAVVVLVVLLLITVPHPLTRDVIPTVVPASPTPTRQPTATITAVASIDQGIWVPTDTPLPPPPVELNGVSLDLIVLVPEDVAQNIRQIYALGQGLGRNPHAFSKLGDSTIENPYFLARFDDGPYNLGDYGYLQPVIDQYKGSFARQSIAVRRGLNTWAVFNANWADKNYCQPNENMLACEFRVHNPVVLFIRLGSNDVGVPESTEKNLRRMIEFSVTNGVIPILGTKADRHEGPDNINNDLIRQIAADYAVPLWDFDLIASTIPGHGLEVDGVHLTSFFAHDWTQPTAMQRGHGVHNLTALMALDRVWRETLREAGG